MATTLMIAYNLATNWKFSIAICTVFKMWYYFWEYQMYTYIWYNEQTDLTRVSLMLVMLEAEVYYCYHIFVSFLKFHFHKSLYKDTIWGTFCVTEFIGWMQYCGCIQVAKWQWDSKSNRAILRHLIQVKSLLGRQVFLLRGQITQDLLKYWQWMVIFFSFWLCHLYFLAIIINYC